MKNINKSKIKEYIEIKKACEINIAEIINIKKGYNKRNIIFIIK